MSVAADPAAQQPPAPDQPARGGRRRTWIVLIVVAAVLLAIGLVVLGALLGSDGDGPGDDGDRTVSAPRDGRDQATFVLLNGADSVTVRTEDLGDRLYRAESPEDGAHRPVAALAGDEVRVELTDATANGASTVDVRLHSGVRWHVRILGGSTEQIIDLRTGQVTAVELLGGATRIELTLPPPSGTAAVTMTGGVGQWIVHQLGEAPVRVRAGGGAGSVTIDGVQNNGVAAGTVFDQPEWDSATDRVDIDAVAGMSSLVLDRLR